MKKLFTVFIFSALATSAQAQNFNNAGMETWQNYSVYLQQYSRPAHWFSADSLLFAMKPLLGNPPFSEQLSQSSNSNSGNSSAEITTKDQDTVGIVGGILSNAQIEVDLFNFDPNDPFSALSYNGGTTINQRIMTVSAFIDMVPQGADKGRIIAQAVLTGQGVGGSDSVVGMGTIDVNATTNFQQMHVPLTYVDPSVVPDRLLVLFMSSGMGGGNVPEAGSIMRIDDVTMSTTSGIETFLMGGNQVALFPNPARESVQLKTDINSSLQVTILDMTGKEVLQTSFEKRTEISIEALSSGQYFFQARNSEGRLVGAGKFLISK